VASLISSSRYRRWPADYVWFTARFPSFVLTRLLEQTHAYVYLLLRST